MMNFGERLKALRMEHGRSQADVASATGFSQTNVSALEKRADLPRETVVQKLADYYEVPLSYFYADERVVVKQRHGIELAKEYLMRIIEGR